MDIDLQDGLVRKAVAQRRRFDAQAGDRPAEGDGLQPGHDQRHQTVCERHLNEPLVGAHVLHVGGTGPLVDTDHPIETGCIESDGSASSGAVRKRFDVRLSRRTRVPIGIAQNLV
jgi:hypothetical protein